MQWMETDQQPEASVSAQLSDKGCTWRPLSRRLWETLFEGQQPEPGFLHFGFSVGGNPSAHQHTLFKSWPLWQRKQPSSPGTAQLGAGQTKQAEVSGMCLVLFRSQASVRQGSLKPCHLSRKCSSANTLTCGTAAIH